MSGAGLYFTNVPKGTCAQCIGPRIYLPEEKFLIVTTEIISYTTIMKTATRLSLKPLQNLMTPVIWQKAAGLLKSKKNTVARELVQSRKSWEKHLK